MSLFTRVARGRLAAWLTVVAAIVVGAAVFGLPKPDNPAPVSSTGLSVEWQSTQVERLQEQLPSSAVQPADRGGQPRRTAPRSPRPTGRRSPASPPTWAGSPPAARSRPPQVSPDGTVALVAVPLSTAGGQDAGRRRPSTSSAAALDDLPDGLTAEVTGGPPSPPTSPRSSTGADTSPCSRSPPAVVALLLLITYRSPFLWIVPLVVVAATEQLTLRAVGHHRPGASASTSRRARSPASPASWSSAPPPTTRCCSSPATARSCAANEDRFAAMRAAAAPHRRAHPRQRRHRRPRRAHPAAVRAGDQPRARRGLRHRCGVRHALGAASCSPPPWCSSAAGCSGRSCPGSASPAREGRLWGRLGTAVLRRPVPVAVLRAPCCSPRLALGGLGIRTGLSETEQFRVKPEAVAGAADPRAGPSPPAPPSRSPCSPTPPRRRR